MTKYIRLILILLLVVPWVGLSQEEVRPEWTKDFERKIADYAISYDGNYIVVTTVPGNIYIFDSTGEEVLNKRIVGQIKEVSISEDGSYVGLITDFPNMWYLYDNNGTELIGKTYEYYSNPIKDIFISKGKTPTIAVYNTGEIIVYNTSGKYIFKNLISEPSLPDDILFKVSSTGNTLVYCDDTTLRISRKSKVTKPGRTYFKDVGGFVYGLLGKCNDISITDDGNYVLAGSEDGSTYFLDLTRIGEEEKLYFVWKHKSGGRVTQSKIIDNNGKYSAIVSSLDGNIHILDSTGEIKETYKSVAMEFKLSSAGNYIVATDDDKRLEFYNIDVKENVVILANSIDYPKATGLFEFLENNGFKTIHANISEIERYKKEKFLMILGGPDAPEGIGEVVQEEVLMLSEQNSIREKGAMKMLIKTNVWTMGQKVIVLAGSGRNETQKAWEENKDNII